MCANLSRNQHAVEVLKASHLSQSPLVFAGFCRLTSPGRATIVRHLIYVEVGPVYERFVS